MRTFKGIILLTTFIFLFLAPTHSMQAQRLRRAASGIYKMAQSMTLTDEDLSKYVKQQVAYMDKKNKVLCEQSAYTKRLRRITQRMNNAKGIKLNFKVYQTSELNAFACPDGSVRVYSALMDALTDNELLGVLGHEIGHVALRHTKEAWKSALRRSAANDFLGVLSNTYGSISESQLGDFASYMLSARHSRQQETEADDYAYSFLVSCGKNPWALILSFEKLKKLTKQTGNRRWNKFLSTFSSHPDFDQRISRLRQRAKRDGFQRPLR